MKVPAGKTVYFGAKKYGPGSTIPDHVVKQLPKETVKKLEAEEENEASGDGDEGTGSSGFGTLIDP